MAFKHTLKRGSTRPALRYPLPGADLTGATATFLMSPRPGQPATVNAPAVIANGALEYHWQHGDTDNAVMHYGEFEVVFPGGAIETFPADDYIRVEIKQDIGDGGTVAPPAPITLTGALVEAGADVASGAGALAIALSGSLVEVASDAAAGTGTVTTPTPGSISLSAALIEAGADTAAVTGTVGITVSAAMVETGVDTAIGDMTVTTIGPTIGGIPIGAAGAAGTIYAGHVLADGDDFDAQPSRWSGRNLTGRYAHSALSYGFRGTNASQDRALYIDPDFRGSRSQSPVNLGYDGVSVANGIAKLTATPAPSELLPYLPQTYTGGRGDAQNRPRLISGSLKTAPSFMLSAQADFVVECKVRLQGGLISGYWPSFWTTTFFWADMGEIDVLEAKKDGTGAMKTLMNYIVNAANGSFQSQTVSQPAIPADRWVRLAARRQGGTLMFYDDIASEGTLALRASTTAHVAQMRGAHDIRLDLAVSQEWDGNNFDISHYPASVEFDYWRAWVPATAAHDNEETLVLPAILAAPGGAWDTSLPPRAELYGAGSGLEQVVAAWDNHDAPGMPTRNGTTKLPASMTVDLAARTVRGTIPATEGGALALLLTYAYDDGSPVRRVMQPYHIAPALQTLPSGWSFNEGDAVDIIIPYTAFHSGNLGPHTYQVTAPGLTVTGNGTTEAKITGAAGSTTQITIEATNIVGQKTTVQRTLSVAAAPPPSTGGYAYETWTGPAWYDFSDDSTLTRAGSQINAVGNKRSGGGNLVGAGAAANRTVVSAAQNGRQGLLITRIADGNLTMPRLEASPNNPVSMLFQGDDKPRTTFTVYKPLGSDTGFIWSASAGIDYSYAQVVAFVRRAANASIRRAVSTGAANNDVSWGSGHAAGIARIVVERHTGTTVTVWDNSLTKSVVDAAQNTAALRTDLQFALATARSNTTSIAGTQASAEYYEFVAEDRALSDADIEQTIRDLAAKWGIALT